MVLNGIVGEGWLRSCRRCSPHSTATESRKHCCISGVCRNQRVHSMSQSMAATWKLLVSSLSSITVMVSQWISIRLTNTPHLYTTLRKLMVVWFLLKKDGNDVLAVSRNNGQGCRTLCPVVAQRSIVEG